MTAKKMATKFAPAERASPEEVVRQSQLFTGKRFLGMLPDMMPCVLMVLNEHRQIIFSNQRLADLVSPERRGKSLLGLRPGEALDCTHGFESEGGCGTTEFCSLCGAVHAILAGQSGHGDIQECRIIRKHNSEAVDLRIWTTPVVVGEERFTICAALDISHEKRRQALEHIFLHDIYNVAYGLSWYADFLRKGTPDKVEEYADTIHRLCGELIDEIDAQRILLRAESGELTLKPERVSSLQVLHEMIAIYRRHPASHDRELHLDEQAADVALVCDKTLLARILGNMVKNALEACHARETVTVGCTAANSMAKFWVHNPGHMSREVQLQIFQRSFSTKGRGRGLGTYSIKLLTERYLKGSVSFTSTPKAGTTFSVYCPLPPNP
ncbi:MAG: HAMP domain-containing histidine kinase [Phycisphaerae bacterium]|nr:HAMP domain-containing histidine kinase [Phycisphaerae bacterium]